MVVSSVCCINIVHVYGRSPYSCHVVLSGLSQLPTIVLVIDSAIV